MHGQLRPLVLLVLLCVACAAPLEAQQRVTPGTTTSADTAAARRALEQQLGRSVSQAEIVDMLRQSGLTRAEARLRMQASGYDPSLVDPYFDILERGGEPRGAASGEFVRALGETGLLERVPLTGAQRERLQQSMPAGDSAWLAADREPEVAPSPVFGKDLFARGRSRFEPMHAGPVDRGYRLGPGDELTLVLTGAVELAYNLEVSREGLIFIPDVGQVPVNGLSLEQLEDVMYSRLGRVYSGVSRSPSAPTRFALSVNRIRVNQIFVLGEVERPAAYQVSGIGTVLNALYQAGGPTENGSFRQVEVYRAGGRAAVVDLYDYLIRGSGSAEIRLEHNDRVFVPPAGTQVRIEGAVRRPAIYELAAGETLADLLAFAGGLQADALVRRIQIDRVLPPEQRRPGISRVLVDVEVIDGAFRQVEELRNGDVVTVFAVPEERRNRVWVMGGVRNPGAYEWRPGSTLWQVIDRADGLTDDAYEARALVYRLDASNASRRLLQAALGGPEGRDLVLADNDSVVVFRRGELRTARSVAIQGYVKEPGTYELAAGMTLRDLILLAQGFTHGAHMLEAEISRVPDVQQRSDTTSHVMRVRLLAGASAGNGAVPDWVPATDDVTLEHGDRVFVRRAPGYEETREVQVTGHVLIPGSYALRTRAERLTDVIARTGGLTGEAYAEGIHVIRGGRVVAGELARALDNPQDRSNIVLEPGDSVHVPGYDPTVTVAGAVTFESRVLYRPGKPLSYYIEQAGGLLPEADLRRITVTYQNGQRAAVRRSAFGRRQPAVQPGSSVLVPHAPEGRRGVAWDLIFNRTTAALTATATLLLALNQIR